jgi:hypothetical protein
LLKGRPEQAALEFLRSEERIGWSGASEDLRLAHSVTSGGGTHLTFQQYVEGVPVIGATTRLSLDRVSKPTFVLNGYRPELEGRQLSKPSIRAGEAEQIAVKAVMGGDASVRAAELAVLPGNPMLLVWKTIVWPETGGEWLVLIDATTGSPVEVQEVTLHRSAAPRARKEGRLIAVLETETLQAVESSGASAQLALGRGMVFDPDPLATSGQPYAPPYTDSDDAEIPELNAERISVDLQDISLFADNKYRLAGPYVEVVGRRPSGLTNYEPPVETQADAFNYTRGDERFEAVMAYYHIDKSQRWVQGLGYDNIMNMSVPVNPFGEGDQDVSNYYLNLNFLSLGGGSVDDAEDAFVIWHEYAHALLNATVPNLTSTFEGRAMHEGWADYWAASYERGLFESGVLPPGDWRRLFRWDGNNPPWLGRQLPEFTRYPDDLTGRTPHEDGLVIASALMGVWDELGRDLTDQLSLQSHFYLTSGATMADMAEAFVQADIDLYDGEHASTIIDVFAARGMVDASTFGPVIVHEPISDTEQVGGSVEVLAQVRGIIASIESVTLVFDIEGQTTREPMSAIGEDRYSATITLPSNPTVVEYYIEALDGQGNEVFFPEGAPGGTLRFQAGPDNLAPVIEHAEIAQVSVLGWPPRITASITDNIGVDTAYVEYSVDDAETGSIVDGGIFGLTREASDTYAGTFPRLEGFIDGDETVSYRLYAMDASVASNEAALPEAGKEPFQFLVASQGTVAFLDFEGTEGGARATGVWEHGSPTYGTRVVRSGSDAWVTALDRAYPAFPGTAELELPPFNLSGLALAWLEFWHWYDLEHDGTALPGTETDATLWDGGFVQVSTNGGTSWTSLTPAGGYDGRIPSGAGNPAENESAFGGSSHGWRRELVQIPGGPDVRVRFVFGHDVSNEEESVAYAGWMIDDVSIRVDRPEDNEVPTLVEGPDPSAEAEAGSQVGPEVMVRVTDNVGIERVEISFEISGSAGVSTGSTRLSQSPVEADLFEGRIPVPPEMTAPGAILSYTINVRDFDGNAILLPEGGSSYRVEYVFVSREDRLASVTPSGGWRDEDGSWLLSADRFGGGAAALVLTPVDLPSDAAEIRFELSHRYSLAGLDLAKVQLSQGGAWEDLDPTDGYPDGQMGFAGAGEGLSVFDLAAYAGQQVQLRVALEANQSLPEGAFWWVNSASTVIKAEGNSFTIPRTLELQPNFPDPFSTSTTLSYTIPEPTVVDLAVFDVLGRKVAQIISEPMEPGTYSRQWNANDLAAGTYFIRLVTKSGTAVESISIFK